MLLTGIPNIVFGISTEVPVPFQEVIPIPPLKAVIAKSPSDEGNVDSIPFS